VRIFGLAIVSTPISARRALVTGPTPHISSTGRTHYRKSQSKMSTDDTIIELWREPSLMTGAQQIASTGMAVVRQFVPVDLIEVVDQ